MAAEDFVISRKRKKYKFARFEELANCFELSEIPPERMVDFVLETRLTVELGAGTGLFLVEQAKLSPDKRFMAVDVKADRLYVGAKEAAEQNVTNIIFVRAHADRLPDILKKHSIHDLWLTCPDPFPKKRHVKHRLTHVNFLRQYRNLLIPEGRLHLKTDNQALFCWSLEQFALATLRLRLLSFDLHRSDAPAAYKIMTTYEHRFVAEQLPIYYAEVSFD